MVVVVFAGVRLLEVGAWTMPAFDSWAYWLTRDGPDYGTSVVGMTGSYHYSPAFFQAIAPLTALPWPAYAAVWTFLTALPLPWLTGRYAIGVLLLPPVFMSVALGHLDLAFAVVCVAGLRWPALWALVILTKVSPGVALIWFIVRREWRSLWIALGATGAITALSVALSPSDWIAWLEFLARADPPPFGEPVYFVPVPLLVRLPIAAALVAWGALEDRRWVLPVAVVIALPVVWLNSPSTLLALVPLLAPQAASRWARVTASWSGAQGAIR